jgi:hypothetical protein
MLRIKTRVVFQCKICFHSFLYQISNSNKLPLLRRYIYNMRTNARNFVQMPVMTNRGTADTDGKVGVTGGDGGEISAVGIGSNESGKVMPPPPESIGSIVSFDEEYGKKATKRCSLSLLLFLYLCEEV